MLRHELRRVVEVDPQEDPAVEDAHRLGRRVNEAPLGQRRGVGVEADDLERVLAVPAANQAGRARATFLA